MPEAGDGWFSKLGNPEHPLSSSYVGPSTLSMPDVVFFVGKGCATTPLVTEKGWAYFTDGLCPKSMGINIALPEGHRSNLPIQAISGTPAISEGHLFVADEMGNARKIDASTAETKWMKQFCGTCGADSWSVAASKSTVIMQGSLNVPSDFTVLPPCDHVFALSPQTGDVQWKFKTKAFLNNMTPCISGDVVILTDMFGTLYCLKLSDGSVKWEVKGEGSMISRSSGGASVCNGVVYQALNLKAKKAPNATCGGRGAIRAYDLKTGEKKWEALYESELLEAHAVPAVTPKGPGGKPAVVVGLGANCGMPPPSPPAGDTWKGKVVALDPKTGKELWAFTPEPHKGACAAGTSEQFPWRVSSWSPAACGGDGLIYIGWHGGFLFVLDGATGEKRSEFQMGAAINGTPALGPGGMLAVSALNWCGIWHAESKTPFHYGKEPTIKPVDRPFSESGTEHFAKHRACVRPYLNDWEAPTDLSKPTWCRWYHERVAGDVNNGACCIDAQRNIWTGWNMGHLRCIKPDGTLRVDCTFSLPISVFNPVLWEQSIIFPDQLCRLSAFDLDTFELKWQKRVGDMMYGSGAGLSVYEDLVLVPCKNNSQGDGEDTIVCVDAKDGNVRWSCPLPVHKVKSYNTFCQVATLRNEGGRKVVIVGALSGGFYAIYLDSGEYYWEVEKPAAFTTASPTVGPNDIVYAAGNTPDDANGFLYAADLQTKTIKWTYDCSREWAKIQPVTQVPVIVPREWTEDKAGDIVCIGIGTITCGFPGEREKLVKLGGEMRGEFVGIDTETGKQRWSFTPPPLRSVYPAGCCDGDTSPPDTFSGAQVSCKGVIYVYFHSGYFFALNGTTGAEISRYYLGSFANGAHAIAPGMLVVACFNRIVVWRDEEIEDKWVAEHADDKRAASFSKPLKGPEAEEEKGTPEIADFMRLSQDLALPFPTVGGELYAKYEAQQGGAAPAAKKAASKKKDDTGEGTMWVVVGGGSTGGIMVRKGEGLKSAELSRLATGAKIKEIEKVGDRLHYEKVSGDGPDFGWVSLSFKSTPLVQKA